MCMVESISATEKLRAAMAAKGGKATCWKRYRRSLRGGLQSVVYVGDPITPGKIVSDRTRQEAGLDQQDGPRISATDDPHTIYRGIHVYTNRAAAAQWAQSWHAVVAVRCLLADLVAAGADDQAVFMKVHLSKRSYAAAMRSASDG